MSSNPIKTARIAAAVLATLLLAGACAPPSGDVSGVEAASAPPALVIDNSGGQAALVTDTGERIEVASTEGGVTVRCVEAEDIVLIDSGTSARAASRHRVAVRALVIGKRDDGHAGVWEIHRDNTVHAISTKDPTKEISDDTSKAPEADEFGGAIQSFFGWTYTLLDIAKNEDGSEVVATGVAATDGDTRLWGWRAPGPASVGVYWVLRRNDEGRFYFAQVARVIGEPNDNTPVYWDDWSGGKSHISFFIRLILNTFRLFFLDWYDEYLETVEDDSLSHEGRTEYSVLGVSQDGEDSKATIDTAAGVTIEPADVPPPPPPPVPTYDRIVIQLFDTYNAFSYFPLDTELTLYAADSTPLKKDTPASLTWAQVDYSKTPPMKSGDIFIVEVKYTGGAFPSHPERGSYAIRVVSEVLGVPAPMAPSTPALTGATDPYETDDGIDPFAADAVVAPLEFGVNTARTFRGPGDVDYFKFQLP